MRNYTRGFISFRTLIAIVIIIAILPLAVLVISYSGNLVFPYDEINDEISLFQLRRILLIAYDVNNNGDSLDFIYHNDDYTLELVNNRLVLSPGYQMFLDKVDELYFEENGNAIYVRYTKNGKTYTEPIIKAKGIYLDDFLDNTDELDEYTTSDE